MCVDLPTNVTETVKYLVILFMFFMTNLFRILHDALFVINSKGNYIHHPTDRMTHYTAFVTSDVQHWLQTISGPIELFLIPTSASQLA